MPGLTGIIGVHSGEPNCAATLECMTGCMMHEPFYSFGKYGDESLGLHIGWTYFQGSVDERQPIWNENRDAFLVLSGEQHAAAEDVDRLRSKGHEFNSQDNDWIVHLYEEEGNDFVRRLNGCFSGLLVDLRQQKVLLFNDRYGLGRVYWHESGNRFYFSSEAKSLLNVLPATRSLDPAGLGEFISLGCVLQNRSLFRGISLLPPGSIWQFKPGLPPAKATYFDPTTWEEQEPFSEEQYYERLKHLFPQVLQRYLGGPKRVGVSLTGGVDSRMVMAWANAAPGFLPCYSFSGKYREPADVRIARKVAAICHQPYQVIPVGHEFLAQFPALAERTVYLSDGVMDVSGSADLFVNRVARHIAPVRLTGNYGGEILRELVAFKPHRGIHKQAFDPGLVAQMDSAAETYATELNGNRLSFVAFKQVPWHHYSRLSVERSQILMRSPYLDNDLVALAYRTPRSLASSNAPALKLIRDGNEQLSRIGTDRAVFAEPAPVLSSLLHLYQEFTFKAEYAYDYGMPHRVAQVDSILRPLHLERLFLGRHKFHHFRIWYRDELSNYLKSVLLDTRTLTRAFFSRPALEQMVNQHLSGARNFTQEFHRILTLELLSRQLLDG